MYLFGKLKTIQVKTLLSICICSTKMKIKTKLSTYICFHLLAPGGDQISVNLTDTLSPLILTTINSIAVFIISIVLSIPVIIMFIIIIPPSSYHITSHIFKFHIHND